MKRKALVIGGSGFIGRQIVKAASNRNFEVWAVSRSQKPRGCHWIQADRTALFRETLVTQSAWDVVIDNIAYNADDMRATLVATPRARFTILNSTISVYRYSNGPLPFKEESVDYQTRPSEENLGDPHWRYAHGKRDAERCLQAAGVPCAILRPTLVVGKEDITARTQWYLGRLKKGEPLPPSERRFHLVSDADVGLAFALVADRTASGIYNIAGEAMSFRSFIETLAGALGKAPAWKTDAVAGPFAFEQDWLVSNERLCTLGWQPTPWTRVAASLA